MIKKILRRGSDFLTARQSNILSAAVVIMLMIAVSRVLGLVRNRVLAHFFSAETLAVYLAAFRLPEVVFEVLIFGALSSAFIPTFTSYLSKDKKEEAWYVASVSLNFAVAIFLLVAVIFFFLARPFYQLIAPGFDSTQIEMVVKLTRLLLLAQGFFIISYFLTGVLESLQRFLIPAIAPLFYNLGIILGAWLLSEKVGILAPTIGAVGGAFLHFLVQLPLAYHLGFRPKVKFDLSHPGVREIGRLALPRIIELSFLQIGKSAELFLASLVSAAAYTYYTFANSLQLLPVGLFGISIAKASLPSLSYQSAAGDLKRFKETLISLFNEIAFLTIPFSIFLMVLRVPIIRLVFGAARFGWEATVQTGYAFSAFCLGVFTQSIVYLLTRAFYALHDTKTPVKISIASMFINITLGAILILGFRLSIWSLALAFSCASIFQGGILFLILTRKLTGLEVRKISIPFLKIVFSSLVSGEVMFFFLKVLDRSVWSKKLSFLGRLSLVLPTSFDKFILDTRYTPNLIYLTVIVGTIGLGIYLLLSWILGLKEIFFLMRIITKVRRFEFLKPRIPKEKESITITSV